VPILIRPVREQLEHDRLIRQLQAKLKRKFDAIANPGDEQNASVKVGTAVLFPDLVLNTSAAPRRLAGVIEVETGESVNNLEAMAQWAHFARVKGGLQLYIPVGSLDIARRLCQDHQIVPAELWSYLWLGDQARFTLVERHAAPEPAPTAKPEKPEKPERPDKAEKPEKPEKPEKAEKAKRPERRAEKKVEKVEKKVEKRPAASKATKPARPAAVRTTAKPAAAKSTTVPRAKAGAARTAAAPRRAAQPTARKTAAPAARKPAAKRR
jgi:hypothetical protein